MFTTISVVTIINLDYICFPHCTFHPHYSPESMSPGESKLPPASLGGSPRLVSGSDPDSFQITASALGLVEHVRFTMSPLRANSLFLTALWLS